MFLTLAYKQMWLNGKDNKQTSSKHAFLSKQGHVVWDLNVCFSALWAINKADRAWEQDSLIIIHTHSIQTKKQAHRRRCEFRVLLVWIWCLRSSSVCLYKKQEYISLNVLFRAYLLVILRFGNKFHLTDVNIIQGCDFIYCSFKWTEWWENEQVKIKVFIEENMGSKPLGRCGWFAL